MEYEKLFSPMNIGGVTVKNRSVMAPMLMGFAEMDGKPNEQLMNYYEERAKGGTGLIITEITRVNDNHGAAAFAQLAMSHDFNIEPMREFANRIHKHGAKLFVQLHHPGRQNVGLLVHTIPISVKLDHATKWYKPLVFKLVPSCKVLLEKRLVPASVCPSKVEPSKFAEGRVRALRHSEIKRLVEDFVRAAVRCKKAGVDGVELHATHGYLIQQFLSPNTNHRTDEYGGSTENRLRFLKEIVEGIRRECGDYPIIVRLTADECYGKIGEPGKGYNLSVGVEYAKAIEAMGVDAIDVSSAAYDTFNYWLEPTSFECGWRAYMTKAVKDAVKIPVLGANLIRSAAQAERQLQDGTQDFVSLGRPHIADPHWAEKVQCGNEKDVKRCICCLYCIQSMQDNAWSGGHGYCSVNPLVGKEELSDQTVKDGNGRVVAIVGAGAAGLTCAEILGKRGFKPIVFEKAGEVGGQLQLANKPPHKEKISWCFEDLKTAAEKYGAEIRLNTCATKELLSELKPYAVIIATGANANKPGSIPGADLPNVFTTTQILNGEVKLEAKNVALIGSGMTGLETAEMLVADKNKVTIVEMLDAVAKGMWFQHLDDILPKLDKAGTKYLVSHKLKSIEEKCVVLENLGKKCDVKLDCDAVVLSLGARSDNKLYSEIKDVMPNVFIVGDASKVGRIADATSAAFDLATNRIK